MKVILKKLLLDCWLSRGKTLLLILSAALSAWGISSVAYSYALSERDFQVNFTQTFPADMEIVVDNYQPGLEEKLLADPEVVDLERREVLGGKVKNENGEWMSLVLFGAEDIKNTRMDVFRVLEPENHRTGKLLIETNARLFLADNADSMIVQFPGSEEMNWKIDGTAHDARQAPARMERCIYAYATSLDALLPLLPNAHKRLLIRTSVSSDRQALQEVAGRLKVIISDAGAQLSVVNIPVPGRHIHQNIVDGISSLQKGSGIILALMGITLLSLILLTWLFPRISDVGVMKAIGASSRRIFFGYSIILLLLIAVGLLLGLPLGYQTAVAYNRLIAFVQNFQVVQEALPLRVHALILLAGTAGPLLFGLFPLSAAARTTVQEAMQKTFYTPVQRIFHLSQGVIQASRMKYGLNNVFRNSSRSLLLVLLSAIGIGLFFTGNNLDYSVRTEMTHFTRSARYEIRVRLAQEIVPDSLAFLSALPFVENISFLKDKGVTYLPPNTAFNETRSVRFLPPTHLIEPDLILQGEVDRSCTDCIYISGEAMRQQFAQFALGSTIELRFSDGERRAYRFSGIFKDMAAIGSPFFVIDEAATRRTNAVAVDLKAGFSDATAAKTIDDALAARGIGQQGIMNVNLRMAQLQGHLAPTYLIIKITGILTMLLGVIGLLIVLNLTIQERTREIGIMKALGASYRSISGLFRQEFLWLNLFALAGGLLLAVPFTAAMCRIVGETVIYHMIPVRNDFPLILGVSVLLLLIQALAIAVYNRFRLQRNARELLEDRF